MRSKESGFVLIMTMFLLMVLAALLAAYTQLTRIELATTKSSRDGATGFNTGEAGLNLRAEAIRASFVGYNRPSGTSPTSTNPCSGGNNGSGSFACQTNTFGTQTVSTYVTEDPSNPQLITVPPGERYQNLTAQEYQYTSFATAKNRSNKIEALLELRFKSRLVPLFQFAAFYNKDLEILPGPSMVLSGPVHTNGDLYLNGNTSLQIAGQVTTVGNLYRGRKNDSTCNSVPVQVMDPSSYRSLYPTCPSRRLITAADIAPFNGMIQTGVPLVTVPQPEELDASPGRTYWDKADLRVVLRLNASHTPVAIEVRSSTNTTDASATTLLNACTGTTLGSSPFLAGSHCVNSTASFRNNRENKNIRMLEVDMRSLLNCLHANSSIIGGKALNESSEGGLVFHFSVSGPDSTVANSRYGVRITNAAQLRPTTGGAPNPIGLTVVTDGAIYLRGDYNATNKIPAAVLVDSFNVLSNNYSNDATSSGALSGRTPTNTTQQVAVLSGTDTTGGVEGAGGQGGAYNGGLENYPRFHENWNGTVTYTYRGSFVSLNRPRHVNGTWVYGGTHYTAPIRNWNYDTSFNSAQNLPPITPRFVYLKQQLFVRDYDQ